MRTFLRMFADDARCSLPVVLPRLAALAVVSSFCAFVAWSSLGIYMGAQVPMSFGDALVGMFGGMGLYRPETGQPFVFPMAWIALFGLTAYVSLDWPLRDLCLPRRR